MLECFSLFPPLPDGYTNKNYFKIVKFTVNCELLLQTVLKILRIEFLRSD